MAWANLSSFYSRSAGSGAASDAGAMWIVVLDISVIAAMQAGYLGESALFVAVAD